MNAMRQEIECVNQENARLKHSFDKLKKQVTHIKHERKLLEVQEERDAIKEQLKNAEMNINEYQKQQSIKTHQLQVVSTPASVKTISARPKSVIKSKTMSSPGSKASNM